ncbi:helix-turn-helix domain-containing protein [Pararobbsia silviterrae]|uniref:Helix-turn-helix domain-containing protein n=1 Tax=Pararobbsia silviterrae TaxID=1792498 RepID=A0A494Y3B3_9BURK|nr:helix-turn-helix domain-containing protein [Pararobbsia silviterrae]RKP55943.1 helix-turn-helix domain-containing protein [Pararobbsia silviterrae]
MRHIPNYSLYGESARPPWYDGFNFEWIPERSKPNDFHIAAHRHDALLQVLYIRGGKGHVFIEEARVDFVPPCIVVLPAQTVHGFVFAPDIDGLVVTAAQRSLETVAHVVSPGLVAVLQHAAMIPVTGESVTDATLMKLFEPIEREFRRSDRGYGAAGISMLVALFVQIARLGERRETSATPGHERRAAHLRRFRELIAEHCRTHEPVEFYADKLGITAAQLGRLCRDELSSSPTALVNAHLMREAQRDLVYSGLSIKQVAHGLGFSDVAYFSRYFRKQTGVTPTQFQATAIKALTTE